MYIGCAKTPLFSDVPSLRSKQAQAGRQPTKQLCKVPSEEAEVHHSLLVGLRRLPGCKPYLHCSLNASCPHPLQHSAWLKLTLALTLRLRLTGQLTLTLKLTLRHRHRHRLTLTLTLGLTLTPAHGCHDQMAVMRKNHSMVLKEVQSVWRKEQIPLKTSAASMPDTTSTTL